MKEQYLLSSQPDRGHSNIVLPWLALVWAGAVAVHFGRWSLLWPQADAQHHPV